MERLFSPRWQDRAGAVFLLLVCAACIGMGVCFPFIRHFDANEAWVPWVGLTLFCALGGGLGAFLIWGLIETFTVYSADEHGITRKGVFGSMTMRWRDVASYTSRSAGLRATYTLTDIYGQPMTVYLGLAANAAEIAEALDAGIARLRDNTIQDFERVSFDRKPGNAEKGVATFAILFGIAIIVGSVFVFLQADQTVTVGGVAFVRGVGIAGALMGLSFSAFLGPYLLTHTFRIDVAAITSGSLFGVRRIPFSAVKSIVSRDMSYKNGTMNTTWVEGADGKNIQFNEAMPNYAEMVAFIRKQAGSAATEAGDAALPGIEKRDLRRAAITSVVLFPVLIAITLALSADPWNRLQRQLIIDRRGISGTARITGWHTARHNKGTLNIVDYAFTAQGREITSGSPVPEVDYRSARIGAPFPIRYVPDTPDLCRSTHSLGKRIAIGDLAVFGIYGVLGVFGGISTGVTLWRKWKKLAAAEPS